MKTIDQFSFAGKKALIRVDFNVPLDKDYTITDDNRMTAALPTIDKILKDGGAILMALYDGAIAGTVGLRKVGEKTYEFTKMAVDENFRRKGIAEAISYASFEKARELGATKVLLYSNTKNAGAIKLYEKIGFKHLPVEPGVYERANVKMEIDINDTLVGTAGQTGLKEAASYIEH